MMKMINHPVISLKRVAIGPVKLGDMKPGSFRHLTEEELNSFKTRYFKEDTDGNVKDLIILSQPSETQPGRGVFQFSDRYSVFDWGEMPDHIPDKGAALCLISAYFFEKFAEKGLKTHYLGLEEDGEIKTVNTVKRPVSRMHVKLFRVIMPVETTGGYDYTRFKEIKSNILIPLEIIYRFSLPEGSSVFRRLKSGQLKPSDLGLTDFPAPGTVLSKPFIDFSTKLEPYDRYLSREEALEISGLSRDKFNQLVDMSIEAALLIKEKYDSIGLVNDDGKFEFALDEEGEPVIIDAAGTPDECRISYNGVKLSKELARYFYRDTPWHREAEQAKKLYGADWREHVTSSPHRLSGDQIEVLASIYRTIANEIIGRKLFSQAPSISNLIEAVEVIADAG